MNSEVAQLEPSEVWTWFEKLNAIPRPSKKEERIIEFAKSAGESLGLKTIVDDCGNVIIKKPATPGMENRKGVILQAHLDMVHQKNGDTEFDFSSQGIVSYIDDDGWVKAKGTTLGADNGMGAASIFAVLASDSIKHGPIEGLFTIDEETGMTGAFELAGGILDGQILLNTDTEDEGELTIGCAGGVDSTAKRSYEQVDAGEGVAFRLLVKGLRGGHSGCEIHLGRGNANKVLNRLLWSCHKNENMGLRIGSMVGGNLRNAIPRESFAVVVVNSDQADSFKQIINAQTEIIQAELKRTEPDLQCTIEPTDVPNKVLNQETNHAILSAIYAAPCGVIRMSNEMEGLVETSTSLSKVKVADGEATVEFLTRSNVETAKDDVNHKVDATFGLAGFTVAHSGNYPGWNPNADSEVLRLMEKLYKDMFGNDPIVNAVHAGLECGIIGSHYPGLDMISFGPTIKNPHSPDEKCEIASVGKYWKFLIDVLENVPQV
jgi:dipeptidase D